MTASGTYTFAPSTGEIVLNAYARIQLRRTALTAEHFADARMEANLLLSEWANRQVNLWTVDLQSQLLTASTAQYTVPATTIMILDAYIETGTGTGIVDRTITPMSRTEFSSLSNKAIEAPPTTFWFDRLIAPTITLWPTPDDNGPYTLYYYRCRQIQDSLVPSGVTPEVPLRWYDAFAAGLAARLARLHAPALMGEARQEAERTWLIAAGQDVENVPLYIVPGLASHYR